MNATQTGILDQETLHKETIDSAFALLLSMRSNAVDYIDLTEVLHHIPLCYTDVRKILNYDITRKQSKNWIKKEQLAILIYNSWGHVTRAKGTIFETDFAQYLSRRGDR